MNLSVILMAATVGFTGEIPKSVTEVELRDVKTPGGERTLSLAAFRDRMQGAWVGQSVGVAYGWPTEFKYKGAAVSNSPYCSP